MQPQPSRRWSPWPWIIVAILGVGMIGFLGIGFAALVGGSSLGAPIGEIDLYGEIADTEGGSLLQSSRGSRDFIRDVEAAQHDDNIKAVVIRINSPGGAAAASQEMYRAVMRLRKSGKPVVCSMGDVAASGGYYTAAACNKIYANASTLTGSIGVRSEFPDVSRLLYKVGVGFNSIVSGKFKDSGDPMRAMRPDERQLFQSQIMTIYNQFVNDVVAGRQEATHGKLTRALALQLADGRAYIGTDAKANMLIDEIGDLHDAIQEAARLANVKGTPRVKKVHGSSFGSTFDSEASSTAVAAASAIGSAAGLAFATELKHQIKEDATNTTPQLR